MAKYTTQISLRLNQDTHDTLDKLAKRYHMRSISALISYWIKQECEAYIAEQNAKME
jgi:predicted DNA-binding protein